MSRRMRNLNLPPSKINAGGPLHSAAAIDSRVYAIVKDYLADHGESPDRPLRARRVLPSVLFQAAQSEDAGLRRLKRTVLEKSVQHVISRISKEEEAIELLMESEGEKEDEDEDMEGLIVYQDTNSLNKSIVGLWDKDRIAAEAVAVSQAPDATDLGTTLSPPLEEVRLVPDEKPAQAAASPIAQPRTKKRERQASSNADAASKRSKPTKPTVTSKEDRSPPTHVMLSDIGGMDHVISLILEVVAMPFKHPELYKYMGVPPPRGVLLHGPPGCGKTMLANAIAAELGVAFISLSAPSIVSGMSGESEKRLREIFDEARSIAPCIIFLDEIDAITPKRESAQTEMVRRIVAQLLTCMDDLTFENTDGNVVMVMGATNLPDSLDPALRRAGRFDREIQMSVPDEISRESILRVLSRKLRLASDFDFRMLAKMTSGFVGADLNALTTAAGIGAIKRIFNNLMPVDPVSAEAISKLENDKLAEAALENIKDKMEIDVIEIPDDEDIPEPQKMQHKLDRKENSIIQQFLKNYPDELTEDQLSTVSITFDDYLTALSSVQPSSQREGFATIPNVTWADVGALDKVRIELQMAIVQPIRHPELYAEVGITAPAGVLLWGPPGCGKTLLAKAVANESRANFISVRGPELLNKWVGESERALRQVFSRARASVPCVIFFDELDALVPRRDDSRESTSRMVNTLLTELDGMSERNGIYVIAATNRPDIIDPAMLRPGRLDKPLFVELPTPEERVQILKTVSKRTPVDESVVFEDIAGDARCRNFSGADIAALVREAAICALRKAVFAEFSDDEKTKNTMASDEREEPSLAVRPPPLEKVLVSAEDFEAALKSVKPSVSDKDRVKYERLGTVFGWQKG
ncbi:P-loop containing nucleoside triphosphate hydrolase protein [Limtongia smithiae]|uniref:P-loop containing nucleoside triphosphate hydrolase protein n=1 Tax=Limtongia smithiae TaxID=1125753 RepID=UPI0034CE24BE